MLFQCWSTVFDAGPTLKQHWRAYGRLLRELTLTTLKYFCTNRGELRVSSI